MYPVFEHTTFLEAERIRFERIQLIGLRLIVRAENTPREEWRQLVLASNSRIYEMRMICVN